MGRRVCFLGHSHLGSWKIRGEQIAEQRPEWHAATDLTNALLNEFDVFCVVKRFNSAWVRKLRDSRKTVVVDVLDGWKQPKDNIKVKTREQARRLFAKRWAKWQFVDGFIFPTQAMKEDLGDPARLSTVIYHHFRPGIEINPVRREVRRIGYEGASAYLSDWLEVLEDYCRKRGLSFSVNPTSLACLDIGIAARGGEHESYLTRRYKSNVKLANFYGSGTPCVMQSDQSGYHETDCGHVRFFESRDALIQILETLTNDYAARKTIHERFIEASKEYDIGAISDHYEQFFDQSLALGKKQPTKFSFFRSAKISQLVRR